MAPGRIAVGLGALAGVALAGYLGTAVAFAGEVPRGGHVAGVDVGGLDRDAAVAKVRAAAQQGAPLTLRAGDRTATLDRVTAGLVVDADRAVDDLVGPALHPVTVWDHLTGVGATGDSGVDTAKLRAAVTGAKAALDVPAKDGGLTFASGGAQPVAPVVGRAVDVDGAVRVVHDRWLTATGPIDVPAAEQQPQVHADEVERAVSEIGRPATSGPLPVKVGGTTVSLPVKAVVPALGTTLGEDGRLALTVDGAKLSAALFAAEPTIGKKPKDAKIVLSGGKPKIVPAVDGVTVDATKLGAAAATALVATDPATRTVVAPVTKKEPDLTTEEAKALGVKERTSTWTTVLTSNAGRTENLRIAARTVNGTLVLPGETFSLNAVLGKRTPEKGYNPAPAISGGRLVQDYGGGVSQMATTIFNNVFFTGLEDIYHKPHSFYISRYPEGREATVNWPTVDLKWRNDSKYAVLTQAWVDTKVHVSFWSTKTWDIEATKSARSNFRAPKTIYDPRPGCVPQDANGGFDVSVGRIFKKDGKVVKRETFRTTYIAEDKVICGPKPGAAPKPSASTPPPR
ncbi:VanW family protein [Kineosporia sp. A_224]|uniref:VanW family protein n=1 Tax=Kineosporia sp. A_224 TaxID=1962180 RepID=UPI00117AFDAC|nr:VanW family protein [Kineosporia sp. A_224]